MNGSGLNTLEKELADPDWRTRWSAAASLGNHGAAAVTSLTTVLEDEHWLVRQAAAASLGMTGDSSAVDHVIFLLQDPVLYVRHYAEVALQDLLASQGPFALSTLQDIKKKFGRKTPLKVQQTIRQLKESARESLALERLQPVCATCLIRFRKYKVKTGLFSSTAFYGCRRCGLTSNRFENIKTVIAVIDEPWSEVFKQQGDTMYVNMVMRDRDAHLAEFDLLEIRFAPSLNLNDELGHILLRSGNDPFMNKEKLETVPVRLVNNPDLNNNSMQLIRMRFSSVESVEE